jgi:hypothetical protein
VDELALGSANAVVMISPANWHKKYAMCRLGVNDLADASLVVAAESLGTRKVFTADRKHFETYRVRRGHRHYPIEIVPAGLMACGSTAPKRRPCPRRRRVSSMAVFEAAR